MAIKTDYFIRTLELANLLEVHSHVIERYVYRGVLQPESYVKHGKTMQPLFLASRLKEYRESIANFLSTLKSAEKERKLAKIEILKKELQRTESLTNG